MQQNLFDWLNSTHKNDGTTGLLLAPMNVIQPEKIELQEITEPEPESEEQEKYEDIAQEIQELRREVEALQEQRIEQTDETHPEKTEEQKEEKTTQITAFNEAWQGEFVQETQPEPDKIDSQAEPELESQEDEIDSDFDSQNLEDESKIDSQPEHEAEPQNESEIISQPESEIESQSEIHEQDDSEDHISILNQAWHEASNLHINLNEPPPEMWTDIDDEDEPKNYEQNMSLQGDAYIPVTKHGTDFTRRLHDTLQGRKDRAAKRREAEAENEDHHPYFHRAVIFCSLMIFTLGLALWALWYVQRKIPDMINEHALNPAQDEIILSGGEPQPESQDQPVLPQSDQAKTESETESKPEPVVFELPQIRGRTYEEFLQEANDAFNIGMYSNALVNFHKAHAANENDIRAYIGLAATYKAKGMYSDARRILKEAQRKFGHDTTVEYELKTLKGVK